MFETVLPKLKESGEKLVEAMTACGLMMVQGDLSVFTINHFGKALEVGLLTAVAYFAALHLEIKNKWAPIWLTGVLTAGMDFVVHPAMFPYESLATGAGAMMIAIIYDKIRRK